MTDDWYHEATWFSQKWHVRLRIRTVRAWRFCRRSRRCWLVIGAIAGFTSGLALGLWLSLAVLP